MKDKNSIISFIPSLYLVPTWGQYSVDQTFPTSNIYKKRLVLFPHFYIGLYNNHVRPSTTGILCETRLNVSAQSSFSFANILAPEDEQQSFKRLFLSLVMKNLSQKLSPSFHISASLHQPTKSVAFLASSPPHSYHSLGIFFVCSLFQSGIRQYLIYPIPRNSPHRPHKKS